MTQAAPNTPLRFSLQPQRIVATAAVITLHLAALGLLLTPLSASISPTLRTERTTIHLVPRIEPEPPRPPLQSTPTLPRPLPTTPHSIPLTPSLPVLVNTVDAAAVTALAEQLLAQADAVTLPAPPMPAGAGSQGLQVRHGPPPAYPGQALRQHWQGEVLLRVQIDAEGAVVAVTIERSSGHRSLDRAAQAQVLKHWRFEPAQVDGIATPAIGLVPINFRRE